MAPHKSEPIIESMGVRTRFVSRQLNKSAALFSRQFNRVAEQRFSDALAAILPIYAHAFDLRPFHPETRQSWNHGQLQAANHFVVIDCDKYGIADLPLNIRKSIEIGLRQRVFIPFSGCSQFIVGQ